MLYFLLMHHELFSKYCLSREDAKELLDSNRYNHDIEILLIKTNIMSDYLSGIIEDQCKKISKKFNLSISKYPNLRYNNCSTKAVSNLIDNNEKPKQIINYDIEKDGDFTAIMIRQFLQVFGDES